MNASIRTLALGSLVAALALGGFAANSAGDKIVGRYVGSLFSVVDTTVGGLPYSDASGDQVNTEWELLFEADHTGRLNDYVDGPWKRKGSRYSLNVSKELRKATAEQSQDPHAKAKCKCTKIAFEATNVIAGKIGISASFTQGMLHYKQIAKGVFGLARATE